MHAARVASELRCVVVSRQRERGLSVARQRVTTACRDCKKCTNSAIADLGRNLGRAYLAIGTAGMSELALAMRKKCRVCGHQMSLHKGADATTPQPAVEVSRAPRPEPQATPVGPPPGLSRPRFR